MSEKQMDEATRGEAVALLEEARDRLPPHVSATPATGFYARPRTRRVECDWLEPAEGQERLWADIRSDIPLGVTDEIPFGREHTHREGWEAVAPWVTAWNALGWDVEAKAYAPVPAPAVGGPEVFKWVDPIIVEWLAFTLRMTYRQVIDPKVSPASEAGANSPNAPGSDSSAPAKPSRRNRTG